jgi:hypothetical protein
MPAALAGTVFVLEAGIAWNQLPTSLVGCSRVTGLVAAAGPGRGRPCCKHHLIWNADVPPLVVSSTGDDRNDLPQVTER